MWRSGRTDMDEDTRVARYEKQNAGRPETPAQRRRRTHKRGHQQRQATMRILRKPGDLSLPAYPSALVFKPYRISETSGDSR